MIDIPDPPTNNLHPPPLPIDSLTPSHEDRLFPLQHPRPTHPAHHHSGPPTTAIADEPGADDAQTSPHRKDSTQQPPPDNTDPFDPADALESLHTEIVQLEAFAHAAGEAVTRLPHSADPKHRRDLTRIYALVSKVATDAATAAHHGDQLIAALFAHCTSRERDNLDS